MKLAQSLGLSILAVVVQIAKGSGLYVTNCDLSPTFSSPNAFHWYVGHTFLSFQQGKINGCPVRCAVECPTQSVNYVVCSSLMLPQRLHCPRHLKPVKLRKWNVALLRCHSSCSMHFLSPGVCPWSRVGQEGLLCIDV